MGLLEKIKALLPKQTHRAMVESYTTPGVFYTVEYDDDRVLSCDCPDYEHRHTIRENYHCKHMAEFEATH